MSDALISSLNFATSTTYVALGIPIIIGGVLGGILNIIVFHIRAFIETVPLKYIFRRYRK